MVLKSNLIPPQIEHYYQSFCIYETPTKPATQQGGGSEGLKCVSEACLCHQSIELLRQVI